MNQLRVLGAEQIGSIKFTGIEGGFGDDKKAMLVKDIADIHGKTTKAINQAINMNRKRFRDGIDVIDLKQEKSGSIKLTEFFTKQQIANYNNIYLLSERGYAKLLKILDDDKAWDIYDELVDNYFNMRSSIKNNQKEIIAGKRLSIMESNAATRKANALYRIAMKTNSNSSKQRILAKAAESIMGEMTIPIMQKKEYSASQVGKKLGITANKVGRIANSINLKAEQPGQNEYGRWANSKSRSSDKEVAQWLYTENGLNLIKQNL